MDENGNSRDDLTLPKGTDESEKLAKQIQEEFDGGKEIYVTVLKVSAANSVVSISFVILLTLRNVHPYSGRLHLLFSSIGDGRKQSAL